MSRTDSLALAFCLVLSCGSYAHSAGPQQQSPAPAASDASKAGSPATVPSTASVPMTEPVLTLKGACESAPGAATPPPGCVRSLTRAEFEKLITALTPPDRPMSPERRRTFATQYAKLLTFADAARAMGLENDPRVQQIFDFAKNQILTEALNQKIIEEYSHPTDQQIADYYTQNSKKYVEVTLERIVIPRATSTGSDKPTPTDAEEKAYAEKIRQRWVAGEDPDKLQKEASARAGAPAAPPATKLGTRRPGSMPEAHDSVFDLKAGELSPVFSDPASFYVYKVVSVRPVPLSEVKTGITTTLQRQMVADRIEQIQKAVMPVLNEAYFGAEKPESAPQQQGPPTPRR
jgi:hypothetical protein